MNTPQRIFHITEAAQVDAARASGEYRPDGFARERFIHCSYAHQVCATADRLFKGRHGLVLLEIDRAGLPVPVVDENLEGGRELYPHVYGPLPMSAVRAIHPFPCGSDGSFILPAAGPPA